MRTVVTRGMMVLALVSLTTIAIALTACGGGSSGPPEDVAQGMERFRSTCATCHGQDARGMPALGKDLHKNPFAMEKSVEELAAFFAEGRPANHPDNERKVEMPPKGGNPTLTDEDLRLIAVYVKSLQ